MVFFLKIALNRYVWSIYLTIILFDLHCMVLKEALNQETIKIDFFGFLKEPMDIAKWEYFPTLVFLFKILAIIALFIIATKLHRTFIGDIRVSKEPLIQTPANINIVKVPYDVNELFSNQNATSVDKNSLSAGKNIKPADHSRDQSFFSDVNFSLEEKSIRGKTSRDKSIDDYLFELQSLVGLESVKSEINSIINFIRVNQMRMEKGLMTLDLSYHMVFSGNPGTGKTTVARILANVFRELNIISNGHLIETDRSGLVAGYMGQTAIKAKEVVDRAKGGVLFIDEAYSLNGESGQNDYGKEAIDTLLKYMEDYRSDLIIIVAGYSDQMNTFINSNPGLKSRFNRYIYFDDYNPVELFTMIQHMCQKAHYTLSGDAEAYLKKFFVYIFESSKDKFGNGRGVRNLFEKMITIHADRMSYFASPSDEELSVIILEDTVKAIKSISKNKM